MNTNVDKLLNKLNLINLPLGREYHYSCLPLAIIDAVYSIGIRYSTTQKVVERYAEANGLSIVKKSDKKDNHTLSDLIANIETQGVENFAIKVLNNKNKVIGDFEKFKSEVVLEWATILKKYGIETFDDFRSIAYPSDEIKCELMEKKGISEVAVKYLYMLCGDDNTCKPDRHIKAFLQNTYNKDFSDEDIQKWFDEAVKELKKEYPNITVRRLDYAIWSYQSKIYQNM